MRAGVGGWGGGVGGVGVVPMACAVLFAPGCQALSVPWVPEGDLPTVWGAPAGRQPGQFPASGSQALLDTGPPREEGFCVGNKPRLGTAPHRAVREPPRSGVSQGWRTKPVGSGAGRGEAGALGSPRPQALSAKRRGPAWGWVASLTTAPTAGRPHPRSSSVPWAGPRLRVAGNGGWRLQTAQHTVGLQARGRLSAVCRAGCQPVAPVP